MLLEGHVDNTHWSEIIPQFPSYLFKPQDAGLDTEYIDYWRIPTFMGTSTTGIQTSRDHFVVDFDPKPIMGRMRDLQDESFSDETLRDQYFSGEGCSTVCTW